jgi:hypothetical protein
MIWEVQIRHNLNLSLILSPIQTVGPAAARAVQHVGARPDQLWSHGTLLPAPAQDGESITANLETELRTATSSQVMYSGVLMQFKLQLFVLYLVVLKNLYFRLFRSAI